MDEGTTTQEETAVKEVQGDKDRPPEAPKEKTEAEKKAEAEAQHKAEDEARKVRLNQSELDIHTLYNYAVQSPNFMNNSKHCMSSYIRLIALIELLGGPAPSVEAIPQDRAARRRDEKELDKGRANAEKAKEKLTDATAK